MIKKTILIALVTISFFLIGFTKEEAVKILEGKNIPVSEKSFDAAYENQDPKTMELLLDAGIDPNIKLRDDMYFTHIMFYISLSDPLDKRLVDYRRVAFKMLDKGMSINPKGDFDPLFTAANAEWTEMVQALIKKGADVNFTNSIGFTPLIAAIQKNNIDVVKILLDAGARKEGSIKREKDGKTKIIPFKKIVQEMNNEKLEQLLFQPKSLIEEIGSFIWKIISSIGWGIVAIAFVFYGFEGLLFLALGVLIIPYVIWILLKHYRD